MSTPFDTRVPKYIVLAEELREQIERNILKGGDRLPTFAEMRARHGVTSATVERIYRHLEKDGLIVREQGAGTFVKQRAERVATNVIGISGSSFLPPMHPFDAQLMAGFHEVAAPAGFQLLLADDNLTNTQGKIDGLLSYDTSFEKNQKQQYLPPGLPCVTAVINALELCSVIADEYQGAYDLVQHLLELGHRRIGYIYDPFLPPRVAGYRSAMRDAGIEIDERWLRVISYMEAPQNSYTAGGYQVMRAWLEGDWDELGCTALLTQNDDTAMGVIHALSEAGRRVPDEVSVAGFDGTETGRYFIPRLTSVEMPLREIGASAMELLLRQIRGEKLRPSTTVLPTRVLPGNSTGPVPPKRKI